MRPEQYNLVMPLAWALFGERWERAVRLWFGSSLGDWTAEFTERAIAKLRETIDKKNE